jgi:hypothetical protein
MLDDAAEAYFVKFDDSAYKYAVTGIISGPHLF